MDTLTIEPADSADLVAMAQCMVIDAEAFPYPSAPFGFRAASARIWLARRQGRVRGFLAGRVRRSALHVEGVAVAPDQRRTGVGRALIRAAVEHAERTDLRAVELHVSVHNRAAIRLYEAEGFDVHERLRGFYPVTAFGPPGDALVMRRLT